MGQTKYYGNESAKDLTVFEKNYLFKQRFYA